VVVYSEWRTQVKIEDPRDYGWSVTTGRSYKGVVGASRLRPRACTRRHDNRLGKDVPPDRKSINRILADSLQTHRVFKAIGGGAWAGMCSAASKPPVGRLQQPVSHGNVLPPQEGFIGGLEKLIGEGEKRLAGFVMGPCLKRWLPRG